MIYEQLGHVDVLPHVAEAIRSVFFNFELEGAPKEN